MERLTDEQLNEVFSFYWSDYSNWFDVDRDMAGKVISVVAELRERRAADAPVVSVEARKLIDDGRFNTSIVSIYDW